jgi:hypothetical protein
MILASEISYVSLPPCSINRPSASSNASRDKCVERMKTKGRDENIGPWLALVSKDEFGSWIMAMFSNMLVYDH